MSSKGRDFSYFLTYFLSTYTFHDSIWYDIIVDKQTKDHFGQQIDNLLEHEPGLVFDKIIRYLETNENPWKDKRVLDRVIDRLTEYTIYREI